MVANLPKTSKDEVVKAFDAQVRKKPHGTFQLLCRNTHAALSRKTKTDFKDRRDKSQEIDVTYGLMAEIYSDVRGQDFLKDVERAQEDPFFWLRKVTEGTENEPIVKPFIEYSVVQYMQLVKKGVADTQMPREMQKILEPVVESDVLEPLLSEHSRENMCKNMRDYMSEDQKKEYDLIKSGRMSHDGKIQETPINPSDISTKPGHTAGQVGEGFLSHAPEGGGRARENRYVGPNAPKPPS